MTFVRTKTVNGRTYRSLEERYREGGKVRSRYIRSLNGGFDRSVDGYSQETADMAQGHAQLEAREKTAAAPAPSEPEKSTSEAPAADSGKENASDEGGEDSGAA